MKKLTRIALTFIALALAPSVARAQVWKDRLVQTPKLAAPERGSVAGTLAGLTFDPGDLARGGFNLPLPITAPTERGPLLAHVFPSYSADAGQGEWGMGFQVGLAIRRFRVVGDLDYATDDFVSPWGRLTRGADGAYYPLGHAGRLRVVLNGGDWTATAPDGTAYRFKGADAVVTAAGTYEWELSEVQTLAGDRTSLTWIRNDSGRPFLSRVTYGGRGALAQYAIDFVYESLTQPFDSYAAGSKISLDRRVQAVTVSVRPAGTGDFEVRWRYELAYTPAPFGPAFYLTSLRKVFRSGEVEPPHVYAYSLDETRLPGATLERYTGLDDFLAKAGDDAIQPDKSALHDLDDDGRLDLENAARQTLVHHTDAGWVYETLPAATGTNAKCRRPASSGNAPRNLTRLFPGAAAPHVVYTELTGSLGSSELLVCDRVGHPLLDTTFAGDWQLGANVKLVDLNRDRRPDLVRVQSNGVDILESSSDQAGIRFTPRAHQSIAFGFTPVATFVQDMNGDGLPDLVLRRTDGITVHHGVGGFRFDPVGQPLVIYGASGAPITSLGSYATSFVDANRDGLADLLLSSASTVFLFTNRGDRFAEVRVAGFAALTWSFGVPVVADLSGRGNVEVAFAGAKKGWVVELAHPDTGLLISADDGKGTVAHFAADRAAPVPGIEQRIPLLTGLTVESSGYAPLSYQFDYASPVAHTRGGFLVGYAVTRRTAPLLVDEVHFHHDDDVSGVVTDTISTDARTDSVRFAHHDFEERVYQGVRWWRPTTSITGVRSADGATELSTRSANVAFEREFCPTVVQSANEHGTLTNDSILADVPALAGVPHCLVRTERMRGVHADATLDFEYVAEIDRNETGQLTALRQLGAEGPHTLQQVTYDAQHRIVDVTHPGFGTTHASYHPGTGLLVETVGADLVANRVNQIDPVTDAMTELGLDRGAGAVWARTYRYDGLERLWKSWDDVGAAGEADPESELRYQYASVAGPASIERHGLVDAASGAHRGSASILSARGESVAEVTRIAEGWSMPSLARTDLVDATKTRYRRHPLSSETSLAALRWDDLMTGAVALGLSRHAGFGHSVLERTTFQQGVEREVTSALSVAGGMLVTTSVENGASTAQSGTDLEGRVRWRQDPTGQISSFTYDALGRLVRAELPDHAVHTLAFDSYGRPKTVARAGVATLRYDYDPATGVPSRKTFVDADGAVERVVDWTRDSLGRLTGETHTQPRTGAARTFRHYYDGALPEGALAGQRGFLTRVEGDGYRSTTEYNRDSSAARTRLRLADWREVTEEWTYFEDGSIKDTIWIVRDGAGVELSRLRETNVLDASGRLGAVQVDGAPFITFAYDADGRMDHAELVSGETILYHYDALTGAPSGYWQDGGAWSGGVDWALDRRGMIAGETIAFGGQSWARTHHYDARGYLDHTQDRSAESTFQYGPSGLPSQATDSAGARNLVRAGRTLAAGGASYRYDALGRVVAKDDLTVTYGPTGEIDGARRGDRSWGYVYNELGERLYKTQGGAPVAAYVGDAYLDSAHLLLPVAVGGRVVGMFDVRPTGKEFELLATDPRGTLLGEHGVPNLPTPFGVRVVRPELSPAFDFVRRGYDADLGTVRMGVRDYDPFLGQFWTPDPLYLEDLDKVAAQPTDGNLYAYARNNPLSFVDPDGRQPTSTPPTGPTCGPEDAAWWGPRGPWEPPGGQPVPFYIGTAAHLAIAETYRLSHAALGEMVVTNDFPISSILTMLRDYGVRSRTAGIEQHDLDLKPDIYNLTTREIYEIKPASQVELAFWQVHNYVRVFRQAGVPAELGATNAIGTEGVLPAPAGWYHYWSPDDGVIVYEYRRVPVAAPVPVRARAPAEVPAPAVDPARYYQAPDEVPAEAPPWWVIVGVGVFIIATDGAGAAILAF